MLQGNAMGIPGAIYTYSWTPTTGLSNPTAQNPMAAPDMLTVYTLVCSSSGQNSPPDSVRVTVSPTPIAEAGPNLTICQGDTVSLMGSYNYTTTNPGSPSGHVYDWSPGLDVSDSTIAQPWSLPAVSSWFHFEVSYQTCVTEDSVFVTVVPALLPVIAQNGNTLTANSNGFAPNYQWYWNGNAIPSATNQPYTFGDTGCYHVEVSEGACSAISDTLCTVVGIKDKDVSNDWKVFPNPFQDHLTIEFSGDQSLALDIALYDVLGQKVWDGGRNSVSPTKNYLNLEPPTLPAGTYFLVLNSKRGIKTIPLRSK